MFLKVIFYNLQKYTFSKNILWMPIKYDSEFKNVIPNLFWIFRSSLLFLINCKVFQNSILKNLVNRPGFCILLALPSPSTNNSKSIILYE